MERLSHVYSILKNSTFLLKWKIGSFLNIPLIETQMRVHVCHCIKTHQTWVLDPPPSLPTSLWTLQTEDHITHMTQAWAPQLYLENDMWHFLRSFIPSLKKVPRKHSTEEISYISKMAASPCGSCSSQSFNTTMSSNPPQSPISLNLQAYGFQSYNQDLPSNFRLSDYLIFDDCSGESTTSADGSSQHPMFENFHNTNQNSGSDPRSSAMQVNWFWFVFTLSKLRIMPFFLFFFVVNFGVLVCVCRNTDYGVNKIKIEAGFRIAFRTKSELENLDDGFKWRKYGKKTVKNSPNPRFMRKIYICLQFNRISDIWCLYYLYISVSW